MRDPSKLGCGEVLKLDIRVLTNAAIGIAESCLIAQLVNRARLALSQIHTKAMPINLIRYLLPGARYSFGACFRAWRSRDVDVGGSGALVLSELSCRRLIMTRWGGDG